MRYSAEHLVYLSAFHTGKRFRRRLGTRFFRGIRGKPVAGTPMSTSIREKQARTQKERTVCLHMCNIRANLGRSLSTTLRGRCKRLNIVAQGFLIKKVGKRKRCRSPSATTSTPPALFVFLWACLSPAVPHPSSILAFPLFSTIPVDEDAKLSAPSAEEQFGE